MTWSTNDSATVRRRVYGTDRHASVNLCLSQPAACTTTTKRREENRICLYSAVNLKRNLRSTYWSYWQTRSIARPLCDSRATCEHYNRSRSCSYDTIRYDTVYLTCSHDKQVALLSQRGRAMHRVIELTLLSRAYVSPYIPLKLCLYLIPFLRYSASKKSVTLKSRVGVVQGHWK